VNLLLKIEYHLILVAGDCIWVVAESSMAHSGILVHSSCALFFLACPEHVANRIVVAALMYFQLLNNLRCRYQCRMSQYFKLF